jgi:hypothetical protein
VPVARTMIGLGMMGALATDETRGQLVQHRFRGVPLWAPESERCEPGESSPTREIRATLAWSRSFQRTN